MKWARWGLVPMLVMSLAAMTLVAGVEAKTSATKSATAKSPEEMAKEALAKWKEVLKLTDEQVPQFESVMTESYQKMAEAKTAAAGDKAKMKASMQTIMSDRDAALAKVLTPDQMKTYHEKLEKMSSKAKEHMSKSESSSKPKS